MAEPARNEFICPECGSHNAAIAEMINTGPEAWPPGNPWGGILEFIHCGRCRRRIPAHLAERWHGQSIAEARREWPREDRGKQRPPGDRTYSRS